jgi:hypothetical protein
MAKKKKNASGIQAKKALDMQMEARFLERLTFIGKALIGAEQFALIPSSVLELFSKLHVPRLKARAVPGAQIPSYKVKQYERLFAEFIKEHTIETEYNVEIPLDWYLTEGAILLHVISLLEGDEFPKAALIREAFEPYLPGSEDYKWIGDILENNVVDVTVFLSELDKYVLQADLTDTLLENPETMSNVILIQRYRPETIKIVLDGHNREAFRVGWIFETTDWEYINIKPAQLGFEGEGASTLMPVYIQQHAINNLQHRIDITPGIMHFAVANSFHDEKFLPVKKDNHSLVPYYLSGQKVGYLLCKWLDNKILISTFLFLTNDGTPEGKNLKKLLLLEKADKEYLRIDTLPHFNSYHFDRDERLSKLFTEAGCGSLLKVGHLKEFSKKVIEDKDPESFRKYLPDAPY